MESRVTELEIKVAYLEKAHDELSEVVRELFSKVESLSKQLREWKDASSGAEGEPPRSLEDDKPPHY